MEGEREEAGGGKKKDEGEVEVGVGGCVDIKAGDECKKISITGAQC